MARWRRDPAGLGDSGGQPCGRSEAPGKGLGFSVIRTINVGVVYATLHGERIPVPGGM